MDASINSPLDGSEMKCNLCHGSYRDQLTVLSFKRDGVAVVVEDVPARVCYVCGDKLITESAVRGVEELPKHAPHATAPVY